MEGEHLPKATMNSFVRQHTDISFTPEFITKLLILSKEYVVKVSDRANDICEHSNKKTISAEHLDAALADFGINQHTARLKELGSNIKEMNQIKREASLRLQERIELALKEQRERGLRQQMSPEKKAVVVRQNFEEINKQKQGKQGDQFDYENLIDVEQEEEIEKGN